MRQNVPQIAMLAPLPRSGTVGTFTKGNGRELNAKYI